MGSFDVESSDQHRAAQAIYVAAVSSHLTNRL